MKILKFNERYIDPPKEEQPLLKKDDFVKIINEDLIDKCHFLWKNDTEKKLFTLIGKSTPFIIETTLTTNLEGKPRKTPYLLKFYYNPKIYLGWVAKDDVKQITESEITAEKYNL
jgi:hypothetical protein